SVPDPRRADIRVYPLHMILHRIIRGFIGGAKFIGVLLPKKRMNVEPGKKKLGALPTRKAVYSVLRRIDWTEANEVLAPLWERLGYTPDLIVRRKTRNPREILEEFREERERAEHEKRERIRAELKARESREGMSAAKAKRRGSPSSVSESPPSDLPSVAEQRVEDSTGIHHDLVIDGKVVKSSYNAGVRERFVHVAKIQQDESGNRSRFIIGARPTELDRNGEWGAAVSVLEALTPLPDDRVVVISADAGFCVEEFCEWLSAKGFFLPVPNQGKCWQHF
ncbi:MAG: hypothetical protein AB7W37_09035, partial [Syntrophobacteraceae bacterium]